MNLLDAHTLDNTVSRVYSEMEGGGAYDNSRLRRGLVQDKLIIARASILGRYLDQYLGTIPGMYFQECCLDVQCVDPCGSGDKVLQVDIPQLIGNLGRRAVSYVGSPDYKHSYDWRDDVLQNQFSSYNPFGDTSKDASYTIVGDKLRILYPHTPNVKKIVVRLIPGNPFECKPCDPKKIWVPIGMLTEIEKLVKLELAGFLLKRKIDKMNNAATDN